jgi:hypothetical protein
MFSLCLLQCSSVRTQLTEYLASDGCKLWRPEHWDEYHFECFDTNGNRAIYKLENGKLYHVPYIDDIVYDWEWKLLNDTTILLADTPYKINKLDRENYLFTSQDGFILSGVDASNLFKLKNCDCKNLIALKK